MYYKHDNWKYNKRKCQLKYLFYGGNHSFFLTFFCVSTFYLTVKLWINKWINKQPGIVPPTFQLIDDLLTLQRHTNYERSYEKFLIPAWKLWARSSWGERWSCDWETMWSPAQHCSCGGSGRCRPLPPISQSRPPACWHHPIAGSLWQSCYWSSKKRNKYTLIISTNVPYLALRYLSKYL